MIFLLVNILFTLVKETSKKALCEQVRPKRISDEILKFNLFVLKLLFMGILRKTEVMLHFYLVSDQTEKKVY